jgi:hypothetical protein
MRRVLRALLALAHSPTPETEMTAPMMNDHEIAQLIQTKIAEDPNSSGWVIALFLMRIENAICERDVSGTSLSERLRSLTATLEAIERKIK